MSQRSVSWQRSGLALTVAGALAMVAGCSDSTSPPQELRTFSMIGCRLDGQFYSLPCQYSIAEPGDSLRVYTGYVILEPDNHWTFTLLESYRQQDEWTPIAPSTYRGLYSVVGTSAEADSLLLVVDSVQGGGSSIALLRPWSLEVFDRWLLQPD